MNGIQSGLFYAFKNQYMFPLSLCPLCGNDAGLALAFHKADIPIYQCPACRVGIAAMPEQFNAAEYYDSSYFNGGRSDGYSDYKQAGMVLHAQFLRELDLLKSLGARSGRLLELGCAYGYFLDVAKEVYQVSGLELCQDAVVSCNSRGHYDVHRGEVSRDTLSRFATADVIVMLDVIEHLPDPVGSLEAAAEKLKPGGLLLMTTGDFSSLLARATGSQWRLMTPPQHLWFFTPRSLQVVCARLDLELVYLDHPWKKVPIGLIVYQLCRYVSLKLALPKWMHRVGIPVNLFDAMRLVFRKRMAS